MTGMPECTRWSTTSALPVAPSSLTAWAPAFIKAPAASTAAAVPRRWARNGMSATSSLSPSDRATADVWATIMSRSAGIVVGWPWTTIATESPTRTASMSVWATSLAIVAS